jgi:hypothetical protein
MILEDKLIDPYRINISNRNVTIELKRTSNLDDPDKDSTEYSLNKGNCSSVPGALRRIEKLKQEDSEITINLNQYSKGLELKIKAYDELLKKFDMPDITSLVEKITRLEKQVTELQKYLKIEK